MAVTRNSPVDPNELDSSTREAQAVEAYRQHKLTRTQLSRELGLSRFEVDALLKRHGIYYDITSEDVRREADELRRLRATDDHRR